MPFTRLSAVAAGLAVVLIGTAVGGPAAADPADTAAGCPDTAQNAVAASTAARACGRPVEDVSGRTQTVSTFANPDGSYTAEISAVPQRVRRADGSWAAIDTTLRVEGGSVVPVAVTDDISFSGGGTAPLVTIAEGRRRVTMSWPSPLPAPHLDGDTATYAEVLPGVDLTVRATATGFTHVLVVKSAAAARDPRLNDLDYVLGGDGVTVTGNEQGGVTVTGDDGTELAHSGGAAMWDSAAGGADPSSVRGPGGGARRTAAATTYRDRHLRIQPDQGLLTGAQVTYPLYIDPAFYGPNASTWAYADSANANNTTDYARVGKDPDDGYLYRSFFQFGMGPLAGARIMSANFEIKLYHSWSCGDTPAYIWRTGAIASTPRTAWSPALSKYLASDSASANKASCYTSATPVMSFGGALASDLQTAVNSNWSTYVVGVTARESDGTGESTQDRWKKFFTNSAYLKVQYNHAPATPLASQMQIDPSFDCSTGNPLTVNAMNGLTLRVRLTDPDSDNVQAQWAVTGISATYAPANSAYAATGTDFTTFIPAAAFADRGSYSWKVRAYDTADPGSYSPTCSFLVDNSQPGTPTVSTSDLALGTGLIVPAPAPDAVVGTAARVQLAPASGDTNIAGYLIGVGNGATRSPSVWVPAAADGTALASVVPLTSSATNYLSVQAKNLTGQGGGVITYKFKANPGASTPHVRYDGTGDGRPDITTLTDVGNGRSALWRWAADGGSLLAPTAPQDVATSYVTTGTLAVNGDFDGDGLSDVAMFQSQGTAGVTLAVQRSDGNALLGSQVWASDASWVFGKMKVAAGNFDGDAAGRTDLVVLYDMGSGNWQMRVFLATGSPGAPSFAAPAVWNAVTSGASQWSAIKLVAVDINGDGEDDLAEYYDRTANSQTQVYLHMSSGTAFGNGSLVWDSGAGGFAWERATFAAGDVNGDGQGDLLAVYRYDNCVTGLWVAMSNGSGLGTNTRLWQSAGGDWCGDKVEPVVADLDADGRADLAAVYRCCGPYQTKLYTFHFNGASFDQPVPQWEGGTGPLGTGSVVVDRTATVKYRLVNANSGRCLTVPGNPVSTVDGVQLVQWDCTSGAAAQLYTVTRVGPATMWLHMTSTSGKCVDLASANASNGTHIQQYGCNTLGYGAAQYFVLEYRSGLTSPLVRIVNRSTGTCVDVSASGTANGTVIQGWACNGTVAQDFYLVPDS